jgi:hypothetical protein
MLHCTSTACPVVTLLSKLPPHVSTGLSNVTVVWSRAEDGGRQQDLRDVSGGCCCSTHR